MRDNGLTASAYTSMGGIDPLVAEPVLTALAEAGIAAYCETPAEAGSAGTSGAGGPSGASGASSSAGGAVAATGGGTGGAVGGAPADPADGEAEAAEATSPTPPSGAEGDAKADSDEGVAAAEAGVPAPTKADEVVPVRVPVGFEEIFVDVESEERARAVIDRSTEDAEWKSLVEQFSAPSAEGHDATPQPRWPASEDVDENSYEPLIDVPAGLIVGDTDEDPPEEPVRRVEDHHDHFIPPEPPKGPKLDWISRLAWLGLVGGPALLILAALLDFGTGRITTIAVVGFIGGFLTLVLRMKDRLPPDDTPDGGAVV